MFVESVREGNELRFAGFKPPFYEVYYLKCVSPDEEWSLWVRYTLLLPRRQSDSATASLWGIFHKRGDPPVALKKTIPLSEIDVLHRHSFIKIDDSFLALHQATGFLDQKDHKISWSLDFEDPTVSLRMYPYAFMYSGGFPKTKFVEPRLSTHVTGQVEVDGRVYRLNHAPAHQAHLWGSQYATGWAWGQCNNVNDFVFEGLEAHVPIGPLKDVRFALFHFIWEGRHYQANTAWHWFFNKSSYDLLRWSFDVRCGSTRFCGELKRAPEQVAGVEYQGPHGEKRYCHSSMMTDLTVTIFQKQGGQWIQVKKIHSPWAAFETVESKPDTRIPFLL